MLCHFDNNVHNAVVRLVDAGTGKVLQQVEPEGLVRGRYLPSIVQGHGTIIIIGKTGASIFHGPGAQAPAGNGKPGAAGDRR